MIAHIIAVKHNKTKILFTLLIKSIFSPFNIKNNKNKKAII